MRAYKIVVIIDGQVTAVRYAGTQAGARAMRDRLMAEHEVKKEDAGIEEVEVPTSKAELLELINELAAGADLVPDGEG